MKRIIAAMLCIACFIGAAPMSYADEPAVSAAGEKAAQVLGALGFLWEDYRPAAGMTRKELAQVCTGLLGMENAQSDDDYFSDIAFNASYGGAVYAAVNSGVLDFMKSDAFLPDEKITYNELLRAVETVLGYNMITDITQWSNIYSYAVSKGLTKNVSPRNGAAVKSEYAAIIIYNALEAPRVVCTAFGSSPQYTLSNDDTVLKFHDIIKSRGIVDATRYTALGGGAKTAADEVSIGGVKYNAVSDACALIGKNTEFYAKYDGLEYTVLCISENKNTVLEIPAAKIRASTQSSITYDASVGEKTVRIPNDVEVVYNSQCIFDYSADMLKPKNGSVTLIDNDGDNAYDVVISEEYTNYIVDDIRKSTLSVSDLNGKGTLLLDADKYENFILEKDGETAVFDDIRRYDVISVYRSEEYIRAVISGAGILAAVTAVDAQERIIEDSSGMQYDCDAEFDISSVSVGSEVTLLADCCGLIAGVNKSGLLNRSAGVLIDVRDDWEAEQVKVKIFTEDNTWVNLTAAEKVRINGDSVKAKALLTRNELFCDGSIGGVAVLYRLNTDGELKELETERVSSNVNTLRKTSEKKYRRFTDYTNSFMPESRYMDLFVDKQTIVFVVPADAAEKYNAEKYRAASMNMFSTNGYYTVAGYNATDTAAADIVLCYSSDSGDINSRASLSVVNRVYTGADSSGDITNIAEVYCDGAKQKLYSETDVFKGLKRGDVIRYSADVNGNVTYVERYFDVENPPLMKQGTQSADLVNITNDFCSVYGMVAGKKDGYITLDLRDNPDGLPKKLIYPAHEAKVYCYNTGDNDITVVTAADIEIGDKLFMRTQTTVAKDILIIR